MLQAEAMILDRVARSSTERYSRREDGVIYVHMLTHPVTMATRRVKPNGFMAIGELIHRGAATVIQEAMQECRIVLVELEDGMVVDEAWRFFYGREGPYIATICGTADGIIDDRPVEIKTTRRGARSSPRWRLQASLYAWLYGSDYAYLSVINVIEGVEDVWRCTALTDEEIEELLRLWAYGRDPIAKAPRCEHVETVRLG